MSEITNNPITNSIDFIAHGTKGTATGMIENQFSTTQTGSNADPHNTSLTSYSYQSDMLTSAYFNAEVGDLRETLGAYQIKIDRNSKTHRAIFVGGKNFRDGNSTTNIDVNVGNYPIDVNDNDTNTGKSWKNNLGIPNMTLKGNSFQSQIPLYPLTLQNKPIKDAKDNNTLSNPDSLSDYSNMPSLMDAMELLKNIFGLSTINSNILSSKPLEYDSNGVGKTIQPTELNNSSTVNYYTDLDQKNQGILGKHIYISLTSSITQWVRVCKLYVKIGSIENLSYSGLNTKDSNGTLTPISIPTAKNIEVKLILSGDYLPRQMIGNGMSHQQLFIWNENGLGDRSSTPANQRNNSILQFSLSNYLIYPAIAHGTQLLEVDKIDTNTVKISMVVSKSDNKYMYVKDFSTSTSTPDLYKIISHTKTSSNINTFVLDKPFPKDGKYEIKIVDTPEFNIYNSKMFNIDYIRDRYAMLQLLAHLSRLYKTSTGLSLPIKLVSYISQVKSHNSLSSLLKYISLYELYQYGTSSSVDISKKMNQIFNFIQNDSLFYNDREGGYFGIALRYWDDLLDCTVTGEPARPSVLNTNSNIISPSDWDTTTNSSSSHKIQSRNTLRNNKVKHVVITNLPGFTNGRYGTSMSSSNQINGFFGSLSIDFSYSDTHTPVDINGMTVHQWDYSNTQNIDGQNNPARWNVNADENYLKMVTSASANC